jgi:DNA (cytosine-5)-methyltransferase 1
MIGIDIFSGAGGLSLGAEWVGIEVLCAIEKDCYSAKTYKTNHPKTNIIVSDIQNIRPNDIAKKGEAFILFGGPPCQGFSTSNRKTRNDGNANNSLFREFLRFTTELYPEWILFENVEGIVNYNNGRTLENIKQSFSDLGYSISDGILYASDYGVPQHRNRFFIVGNRKNISFVFPEKMDNVISVGDAINDLPLLNNGDVFEKLPYRKDIKPSSYAKIMRKNSEFSTQNIVSRNFDYVVERYKYIKPGQNWRAIPEHLMVNYKNRDNCHSGIYKRLRVDEPSVVISNYRKNMLIHPIQDRGLSVREAARLQSFPDNFIFEGSIHYIQQQIGNAVPPLLAKAIFEQILKLNK